MTFQLAAGRGNDVVELFREHALPLYKNNQAMVRFRGYREVESPVPLDIMLVSTFHGMAGMDESNERLRSLAAASGRPIGAIYGEIAGMSRGHHDQFVSMIDHVATRSSDAAPLMVFESIELASEDDRAFETHLVELSAWEQESAILRGSETGRVLIGSGWHYVRFLGIDHLAALEQHLTALREQSFYRRIAPGIRRVQRVVAGIIPELSVR